MDSPAKPDNQPDAPRPGQTIRGTLLSHLTNVVQGSTPFISIFLLIHLSAPVLANVGGSSLSSQVMLLGREYYQTAFGEAYLVLLPLTLHPLTATLKRILSPHSPRPPSSLLTITGYTTLLFLPIHFLTHRLAPASPLPPIGSIGPAELDYEFVKAGLSAWPLRSWVLYSGLALGVAFHMGEGTHLMWNTWEPHATEKWRSFGKTTRRVIAAACAFPVISGLFALSQEPLLLFASTLERIHASFTQSIIFRI
ncbi:hypothetical protein HETIRDRAFT_308980 [Heterobasidion irregulare TC 32-1]|uniref:Mitochondrial adapter protein MCP1 transmembrane domain-containing protein n=1 Tax=Heterobasidion irregulare (strain TC 32-1) TaxID=747525 RepID=W4KH29_HETIT|nr:uncharacterized protein HETIRDRAFT_308980 [Heterobasidion irregulare TC 32-1]ETW85152.1 hypothetical protein HETIRDRAFT_308980 [Heterobasidion irregulare TC 32-1]